MIIAIDAGHSPLCAGTHAGDLHDAGLLPGLPYSAGLCNECDLTLDTATRVMHHVHLHDVATTWTRPDPDIASLSRNLHARVDAALRAGAKRFISIHYNAPPSGTGMEAIYQPGDHRGRAFAEAVLRGAIGAVNRSPDWRDIRSRGVKATGRAIHILTALHQAMPICILECAFPIKDGDLCKNRRWRELLAAGVAKALVDHLT